jgi:hypothetical protein
MVFLIGLFSVSGSVAAHVPPVGGTCAAISREVGCLECGSAPEAGRYFFHLPFDLVVVQHGVEVD